MRSLTWKLGLAFVVVSIIGALVAALFVHIATQQGFQNISFEQAKSNFARNMAGYYQYNNDSWDGVTQFVEHQGPQGPPNQGGQHQFSPFVLVDQQGIVLVPGQDFPLNYPVSPSQRAKGTPVLVNGQTVGTVLVDGSPPPLSPQDQQILASTQQALILGSLAAFLIALGLGLILARSLTRPVRELTTALHAIAGGEFQQAVPVRSRDELGELSTAFNQMSADLASANRQRRQMTADIAHDLRTPVTVIGGYLEALRDGVLPPTPERFAILYEESQHLQGLIEDLRTLSLADAGELTLRRQPIAPATLLHRIAAIYAHQAEQQGIALRVEAPGHLPALNVDADRMVQVLSNLVSNALRYTPTDGSITISAGQSDGSMLLNVQDTGQGIAPATLPRIFDRFYRADNARAQSQGESGLGLAIAKALVEAHGGSINAANAPEAGATFTIRLPVG
jgi:signal transduction histidine kinase